MFLILVNDVIVGSLAHWFIMLVVGRTCQIQIDVVLTMADVLFTN